MADLAPTAANVVKTTDTTVVSGTAGTTITAGMSVYSKAADSNKIYPADANVTTVEAVCVGIALNSASAGQPVSYASGGSVTLGTVTGGAAGLVVVVSATAGGLAPDADISAGQYLTVVGVLTSATVIKIALNVTNITHA